MSIKKGKMGRQVGFGWTWERLFVGVQLVTVSLVVVSVSVGAETTITTTTTIPSPLASLSVSSPEGSFNFTTNTNNATNNNSNSSDVTTSTPSSSLRMSSDSDESTTANMTDSTSSNAGSTSTTWSPTSTGDSTTVSSNSTPASLQSAVLNDTARQGRADGIFTSANNNSVNGSDSSSHGNDSAIFYDRCADRKSGVVCYGDRSNCIKSRSCTFVGAISENDSIISVELLTRVYNPPYDGVNLTVELSRDKKGNESVIRCSKPRFKSFQIRISWKNKTSYEPGNETQTARTIIDKNQLIANCSADPVGSAGGSPSQNLALKFYIQNNNTLVSQGLSHVPIQEPKVKASNSSLASSSSSSNPNSTSSDGSSRQGRVLNSNGDPSPQMDNKPSREEVLYEMCLKPTAKCFGDRTGCTEGHNCTILGVLRENSTNYNLYVVTRGYNPPVEHINLTLTLGTGQIPMDIMNSDNSTNTTAGPIHHQHHECDKPSFKDLSVQSIWRTSQPVPEPTNATQILETTVDKLKLKTKCTSDLDNLNVTDDTSFRESIQFLLKFHLENGSLVPLEVSSELSSGNETTDLLFHEGGAFEIGRNGTAYLISDNNASLVILDDDILEDSKATAISANSGVSQSVTTRVVTLALISSPILILTSLKTLLLL